MCPFSIAIDGPAGAGKSTVAKLLAKKLNFLYIDSGAMYRTITWLAIHEKICVKDESALLLNLKKHCIEFKKNSNCQLEVFVDHKNITELLRTPIISEHVSLVSKHIQIRNLLTHWQRQFAEKDSVVIDGRDIGTVVLPNANLKIFLTANLVERSKRRAEEFMQKGYPVDIDQIMVTILERDQQDQMRNIAPLQKARDAIQIDSSGKNIEEVVNEILLLAEKVFHE